MKERIRELTTKDPRDFITVRVERRRYLVGWPGYFGFRETPSVLPALEEWTRLRLRCLIWQQWKRGKVWCCGPT